MLRSAALVVCLALGAAACSSPVRTEPYPEIDQAQIAAHVDRIEQAEDLGTGAGSEGERVTMDYLSATFNGFGLHVETQPVPVVKIRPLATSLTMTGPLGGTRALTHGRDFIAWTRRSEPATTVSAEIVFVGFGISAPQQGWDDYKSTDVTGKVVVMLSGDPRSGDRPRLGPIGRDVLGRRTYKFEEAARRGAAGALLIHLDDRTQPWDVLVRTAVEIQDLAVVRGATPPLQVEGWLSRPAVTALIANAGRTFEDLIDLADQPNFKPIALPVRASFDIQSDITTVTATTLIATLDPQDDEAAVAQTQPYVLISSHWNDLPDPGATLGRLSAEAPENEPPGVAVIVETARALARAPERRPFVFLVVTAESDGMFGLEYYLENPRHPLARTRAAVHLAGFSMHPDDRELRFVGTGYQALKGMVRDVAANEFRATSNDTDPQRLDYYRSTSATYTAHGIPSVVLTSRDLVHPGDTRDMSVAALDARLLYHLALGISKAGYWPQWTPIGVATPGGTPPLPTGAFSSR